MTKIAWRGLLAAVALAALAAFVASDRPDGLQRVAADEGFAATEREHALDDAPLAGYTFEGVEDRGGALIAGAAGVIAVAALTWLGMNALRRRRGEDAT
ncbi:MAG TPA: PDGLE domain-containing protein [Actinomycetota bacterium]|nr:PDGLE domain-containing protein [Actinomycetota bacterium]